MPARTGAEYLNRLCERRELWFVGEPVRDVTSSYDRSAAVDVDRATALLARSALGPAASR